MGANLNRLGHLEPLLNAGSGENRLQALGAVSEQTMASISTSGRGLFLAEAALSSLDLKGIDLRIATLNRAQLYGTNLTDANLAGAEIVCAGLERTKFIRANLDRAYVHAMAAQACDFSGAKLTNIADGTGGLFHGCALKRASFDGSNFNGTLFYQCDLSETSFRGASLQGAVFNECLLSDADFDGAIVDETVVNKCNCLRLSLSRVTGSNLTISRPTCSDQLSLVSAHLPSLRLCLLRAACMNADHLNAPNASIQECFLPKASLMWANLTGSTWTHVMSDLSNLRRACLDGASIISCSFADANFEGIKADNIRVLETSMPRATFAGMNGRFISIRDSDLSGADMEGAYLYRAIITGDPPGSALLVQANLRNANLAQAYIAADLSGAHLNNANLVYARLNQSILRDADLTGVNLFQASLVKTILVGALLTGVKPPFFVSRCPGLSDSTECKADPALLEYVSSISTAMSTTRVGST